MMHSAHAVTLSLVDDMRTLASLSHNMEIHHSLIRYLLQGYYKAKIIVNTRTRNLRGPDSDHDDTDTGSCINPLFLRSGLTILSASAYPTWSTGNNRQQKAIRIRNKHPNDSQAVD